MKRKTQRWMKHKPQAQVQRQCLVCFLACLFLVKNTLILFLGLQGICPRKYCKGGLGEGWENNGIGVLDQVWGTGPRGGTPERKKVRWSQERVCAEVQAGLGGAGRPYLMASVFSMTGWHLLSRRKARVEAEKTDEDLEALMKWMGKGQLWLYRRIAEQS